MRRHLSFACAAETLIGTLDSAAGRAGLLIVSGGNEIRSGAFSGQAQIAARIAAEGFPVFRFDRRGIGDSSGENAGYLGSQADIAAAIDAFRALCPQMQAIIAFGNCDAASALMLGAGHGADGLILANPWTFEDTAHGAAPPPQAIRARYTERLRNPREWLRLLRGGVDLGKLARGLIAAIRPAPAASGLFEDMRQGLERFEGNGANAQILLAGRTLPVAGGAAPLEHVAGKRRAGHPGP